MGKVNLNCEVCGRTFIDYAFKKRRFCSQECNAKRPDNGFRGKKHSPESIERFREIAELKRDQISKGWFTKGHNKWDHPNVKKNWIQKGQKPKNWLGGKRWPSQIIKDDPRYARWRTAVFIRDNYTCQICGTRGGELNADHIKAKTKYPELAFQLSNGRTLCISCHRQTDNYGGRALR